MHRFLVLVLVATLLDAGTFGQAAARTQLVKNGDFEQDSDKDGFPDFWRGHNLSPDDGLELDPDGFFHQVFAVRGEPGLNKALRQAIKAKLEAGTLITFEAMSKPRGASESGGLYAFKVEFVFEDSTREVVLKLFSPDLEGWSRRTGSFELAKDLKRIVVSVLFNNQTGKAWFDRVSVWDEFGS